MKTLTDSLYISDSQRTTHAQVIGTTGSGKTESVILPWIIQDIKNKKGVLIIDGKSDNSFLEKLYSYVCHFKRKKDFKLFSLANIEKSHSFNPLNGRSSVEITEKVFSSFEFENEYYKNVQYKIFLNLIGLIKEKGIPTFKKVHDLLTDMDTLENALKSCKNKEIKSQLKNFMALSQKEREERTSGLESQLSHFIQKDCKELFTESKKDISMDEALSKGSILYFQLPTMLYPFLGKATGKLVLQNLQSGISLRHLESKNKNLFSVYLDDFQDYIYQGFGSLLNKSRSANIAMVFSHQSLGDLKKVSASFLDVVLGNTNLKVIFRVNDPETCDYFAKYFGTVSSFKTTEQTDYKFLGKDKTGKGTLRKVEEYVFHPNTFKKIPVGSALVSIPELDTVKAYELSLPRLKPIKVKKLRNIKKEDFKEKNIKPKIKERDNKDFKKDNQEEIKNRMDKRRKKDEFVEIKEKRL